MVPACGIWFSPNKQTTPLVFNSTKTGGAMPLMIHCPTLCPDRHRSDLSQGLRTVVRKRIRRIFDDASPRQAAGATHRLQPHGAKVSEPFEICAPPLQTHRHADYNMHFPKMQTEQSCTCSVCIRSVFFPLSVHLTVTPVQTIYSYSCSTRRESSLLWIFRSLSSGHPRR